MSIIQRCIALSLVMFLSGVPLLGQGSTYIPGRERVDAAAKRKTEIDGNNVRASVFNYLFSGRLDVGQGVAYEWPKNTKREYIALVALFIGGEVIDNEGNLIRVVDLPSYRQSPGGDNWNMLPIPGYFNTDRPDGGIIAKSDEPTSWPASWPDKLSDPQDPGWRGSWNGYFGKNQFSADQEMFYRVGDNNYNRYNYTPDTTDRSRKGLGMIVDSRVMEWSQVSVADAVFFIHEFKNDGTKDIRRVGTTIWLADLVGGDGDSQDDTPDFDLRQAVAFSLDKDGTSSNPAYLNQCVGGVATSFLETPGNAVDRIDNDGDSPEGPYTGGGPKVTRALIAGEIPNNGIDDNNNSLTDEDTTYVEFGTQLAVTFADGIDNNDDGEQESPVVTQQMINQAASDRWHRWPPNPETDPVEQGLDGRPIVHLVDVGPEDLGKRFKDNMDNFEDPRPQYQGYNDLPRVTQGMIDSASQDIYNRYRVPGTNVILYGLTQASFGKRYLNRDGLRDPNVDENIDEMIDESRDDGVDNNSDWNPATDDVGLDGAPSTQDFGEGDGKPTSGAGTAFPGEPHTDKTDVKEADQIGVTNVQYNHAGSINFNTTADITYWATFMTPGSFVDPAAIRAAGPGDYDLFVSSGFFPLKAGQTERVSYAVVMGNETQCPHAVGGGTARGDALRKRVTAQLAYNENYQFAQVPVEPHVTAVAGDHKVTLYWDDAAEQSFDRFLAGIPGADPRDFEGYRIYRSTDPAFQDANILRDMFGNPAPFWKPIAQFDLSDGITGKSSVDINGISFYMGDDTGLLHTWTDTTVQNGQKYYYAVRAYDKGYGPLLLAPSESNVRISIDNVTGQIKEIGPSVAIVKPEAPVAGYLPPTVSEIALVGGSATGRIGYNIVDPTVVKEGHRYRITFEDTILAGRFGVADSFRTRAYTLADVTAPGALDTLVDRKRGVADADEQPVVNGFQVTFRNEKRHGGDTTQTHANTADAFRFLVSPWSGGNIVGQERPNDYKIIFGAVGIDTSTEFLIDDINQTVVPSMPVNFKVINASENHKIRFAFLELDDASGPGVFSAVYDPIYPNASRSDYIIFLENNSHDTLVTSWFMQAKFDSSRTNFQPGDTLTFVPYKIFGPRDVYEFTTSAQKVDPNAAKLDLDKIKVVPNPYVAAATWEERNPYSSGRGPRSIHFIHLPQQCTIRIFTISGELVATLQHEGTLTNGTEEWNLLTRDNLSVAYGIYIYHVEAAGVGDKIGKFAVIK